MSLSAAALAGPGRKHTPPADVRATEHWALPAGVSKAMRSGMEQPDQIEIRQSWDLVPYCDALEAMTARNAAVAEGKANEMVWFLEHPPVYTAGTSATDNELLDARFEVVQTGRGGRYTYHGPGQRVGYLVLDIGRRSRDVRSFVHALESWIIDTLGDFGVKAWRADGRVGIWTQGADGREAKIGAIGIRIRRWVTMHGFAVNLAPDLSHFGGIVPCGIDEYGVTSLSALGIAVAPNDWDHAMLARIEPFFARLMSGGSPGLAAKDTL